MKNLVIQAYEYHQAHKEGKPWELDYGDYVLIKTLVATPAGPFARKAIFGFIARGANTIKIVYRGTNSPHDWLTNGKLNLVAHPIGMVHEGFYELYKQMRPQILGSIEQNVGFEVDIEAHSLGCSQAAFTAYDLYRHNPHVKLYASPRIGDIEFAGNYNRLIKNTTRYVNTEDVVPTLPTPLHYCHVGANFKFITHHTGDVAKNHSMALYSELFDV